MRKIIHTMNEKEILNAREWVKESNVCIYNGLWFVVAGAVAIILWVEYNIPMGMRVGIWGISLLIWAGMMSESHFFIARRKLQQLLEEEKSLKTK
jgi:hypothetical protein